MKKKTKKTVREKRTVKKSKKQSRPRSGSRQGAGKNRKPKPVKHHRKRGRVTDEIIKSLISRSRGRGFLTEQEIIKAVPRIEEDIEGPIHLQPRDAGTVGAVDLVEEAADDDAAIGLECHRANGTVRTEAGVE